MHLLKYVIFFSELINKMSESLAVVLSNLKACVISTKDGIPLNKLDGKLIYMYTIIFYIKNTYVYDIIILFGWLAFEIPFFTISYSFVYKEFFYHLK
jgi:hypothetical protein